ncbi:MAG: response regulator [Deltaproteobacteria bacterium]|nr:response regulator [Deltaproteobacteria bacterium]
MSQGLSLSCTAQGETVGKDCKILSAVHDLHKVLIKTDSMQEILSVGADFIMSEIEQYQGIIYCINPLTEQLIGCIWHQGFSIEDFCLDLNKKEALVNMKFPSDVAKDAYRLIEDFFDRRKYASEDPQFFLSGGFVVFPLTINKKFAGEIACVRREGMPHDHFLAMSLMGDILESALTRATIIEQNKADRDRMEMELIRGQKLESLGVMVGGIAHDFNNILTAISGSISLAKMYLKPEDKAFQKLEQADKAFLQAKELTHQFLTFSKKGNAPMKKALELAGMIKDACEFALAGSRVQCETVIPEDLMQVHADRGQINQVINNLLINAKQAMPDGGTVRVKAENVVLRDDNGLHLKAGKYVKISVQDQGVGILEKNLLKIFDPYFTTKAEGNGLGLPTAYSIVKKHGGTITVDSMPNRGSVFSVFLPASEQTVHREVPRNKKTIGGKERILIMDDEENLRVLVGEMLESIGYKVSLAKDGEEAIESIRFASKSDNPFDAVILDLTVPGGIGGKDVIKELRKISPESKAIVSSGYTNDPVMLNFREYGFNEVIAKPYQLGDLSEVLHKALSSTN